MKLTITKLTPKLYDEFNKFAEGHIACKECKKIELVYFTNGIFRCSHCGEFNEFNDKDILNFLNFAHKELVI